MHLIERDLMVLALAKRPQTLTPVNISCFYPSTNRSDASRVRQVVRRKEECTLLEVEMGQYLSNTSIDRPLDLGGWQRRWQSKSEGRSALARTGFASVRNCSAVLFRDAFR